MLVFSLVVNQISSLFKFSLFSADCRKVLIAFPTCFSFSYHSALSNPRYPACSACVTAETVSPPRVLYTPKWIRGMRVLLLRRWVDVSEYSVIFALVLCGHTEIWVTLHKKSAKKRREFCTLRVHYESGNEDNLTIRNIFSISTTVYTDRDKMKWNNQYKNAIIATGSMLLGYWGNNQHIIQYLIQAR